MIARFGGVSLTCDSCADEYVDVATADGAGHVDRASLVDAALAEGWTLGSDGRVGCPRHAAAVSFITDGQQGGPDLFGRAA